MLEYGFLLKKVIAAFCMPLPLAGILLLSGTLLWKSRFRFLGKMLIALAVTFIYVVSIQPTAEWMSAYLERQYPAYADSDNQRADYVLVLGSSHSTDETQPITSFLSNIGLARLMEGIRIYRLNPGSKLLLSGYEGRDELSHAAALKRVADYLGVPEQDMILEPNVKDTREEAAHWVGLVKNKSLVVVTSATHMPRSMYLFEQAAKEANYLPQLYAGPTDFISHYNSHIKWDGWIPSAYDLYRVERAWHEYLGILWAKLNS